MTAFATKKKTVALQERTAGLSAIFHTIDPSALASYPSVADTISFFDIPAGYRIVQSSISTSAAVGGAGSTLKLQTLPSGGSTADLTATTAADSASSMVQSLAPPAVQTVVSTIQTVVGTAALNGAGNIEVMVLITPIP